MPRTPVDYVTSNLQVETLQDHLRKKSSRLADYFARRRGLAAVVSSQMEPNLPVVGGALRQHEIYDAAKPNIMRFVLPRWEVDDGPSGQPAVELRWLGEVTDEAEGIADLQVDLRAVFPAGAIERGVLPLEHTLEVTLNYVVGAEGGLNKTERLRFDRVIQTGPQRRRMLRRIGSMEELTRIGAAMSEATHNCHLELTLSARVLQRTRRMALREGTMESVRLQGALLRRTARLQPLVLPHSATLGQLPAAHRLVAVRRASSVVETAGGVRGTELRAVDTYAGRGVRAVELVRRVAGERPVAERLPSAERPTAIEHPVGERRPTDELRPTGERAPTIERRSSPAPPTSPTAGRSAPVATRIPIVAARPAGAIAGTVAVRHAQPEGRAGGASTHTTAIVPREFTMTMMRHRGHRVPMAVAMGMARDHKAMAYTAAIARDAELKPDINIRRRRIEAVTRAAVLADVASSEAVRARLSKSDVRVEGKKALPSFQLDIQRETVYIRRDLDARQHLPFHFPRDTHPDVYKALPGEVAFQPFTLIARPVQHEGRTINFFQDSQLTDTFYYLPEAFRLARADAPPFDPLLAVAFDDPVTEGDNDEADVNYRVEVGLWARPVLSRGVRAAAQQVLQAFCGDATPLLVPVNSPVAGFELQRVAGEFDGEAPNLDGDLDDHLQFELELDYTRFTELYAAMAQPAPAITGTVQTNLQVRGTASHVPLEVSFFNTVGPTFDLVGVVPSDGGRIDFLLRNELPTPARVDEIRLSTMVPGATVQAVGGPEPGTVVPPGGEIAVTCRLEPPEQPIELIAVEVDAQMASYDASLVWPRLMLTRGFSSLVHVVEISVENPSAYFGQSPHEGLGPLTAIEVEFLDETTVTLSALEPSSEVQLRMSVAHALENEAAAKRYVYRVKDVHGTDDGMSGPWTPAMGGAPLIVIPASVVACRIE